MQSKYTVKLVSCIRTGDRVQEAVVPNRILRYVPANKWGEEQMKIEGDQRYVACLINDLGLA